MKLTLYANRWIPRDSTPVEFPDVNAVVYAYPMSGSGREGAVAYSGGRNRPDWHHSFRSVDRRDAHIRDWVGGLRNRAEQRAKWKARRQEENRRPNPFKAGDILHYAWGYEQTNCEFYQVVEAKARTIVMRRVAAEPVIGSDGFMSDRVKAVRDEFLAGEAPLLKVVKWSGEHPYVSMNFGSACPWDGRPRYRSWYA